MRRSDINGFKQCDHYAAMTGVVLRYAYITIASKCHGIPRRWYSRVPKRIHVFHVTAGSRCKVQKRIVFQVQIIIFEKLTIFKLILMRG